jgi:hypothetical protein
MSYNTEKKVSGNGCTGCCKTCKNRKVKSLPIKLEKIDVGNNAG